MPELICLDTNIIIWGIKKQASNPQKHNIIRAEYLINKLLKNKDRVIIPSIVVGEAAVRIDPSERTRFFMTISEKFQIAPFDSMAATKYPSLFLQGLQECQVQEAVNGGENGKRAIKQDCMILAIALAAGATCIYTTDTRLANRAAQHITVHGLPDVPPQPLSLPIK